MQKMLLQNALHRSVIVTSPGARLAMQTAFALQEAQLLRYFVTSYYFEQSSYLTKCIERFPAAISTRIITELKRRHLEGLNEEFVRAFPHIELAYAFLKRMQLGSHGRLGSWRNARLANGYRKVIERFSPRAVICCDSWAHRVFPACPQGEVLRILDQNTGHITAMAKTLGEERELHPDMADTITPFSEELIERCTAEALSADAIFVSSDFAKESLTDIGVDSARIYHIPYAADADRFCPVDRSKRDQVRFLFVGLIGQRKGIKYLLEAFQRLKLPNAELECVGVPLGSGKGLAPYRELFIHTPSVPYQNVHTCFQNADVFVMPTLHESGVLAIHEALACGLPVITTPNAGSIVRDGKDGFVVPIRDTESLQEKMELLYQDKALREEMSQNARARAEQFTWEHYRTRIKETVSGLLTEKSFNFQEEIP